MRAATILVIAAVLIGCERRPLTDLDSNLRVNIEIDRDIVNYDMKSDPGMMRVIFYESASRHFSTQAFTPSTGDQVSVFPGRDYHVMVYNFDTENTVIKSENRHDRIYASTNEISDSYRSRLRSRGTKNSTEMIVFEPDHLFVGDSIGVYIAPRVVDSPETSIDVTVRTVVQTWILEVDKIEGIEWVSSISGVISGLAGSMNLSAREAEEGTVSIFIEPSHIDYTTGKVRVRFNTFGYIPTEKQEVSLVITDTGGRGHIVTEDVSEQFSEGNHEQTLYIKTDKIVINEPPISESGGGGFAPEVGEWDSVDVPIEI